MPASITEVNIKGRLQPDWKCLPISYFVLQLCIIWIVFYALLCTTFYGGSQSSNF